MDVHAFDGIEYLPIVFLVIGAVIAIGLWELAEYLISHIEVTIKWIN